MENLDNFCQRAEIEEHLNASGMLKEETYLCCLNDSLSWYNTKISVKLIKAFLSKARGAGGSSVGGSLGIMELCGCTFSMKTKSKGLNRNIICLCY